MTARRSVAVLTAAGALALVPSPASASVCTASVLCGVIAHDLASSARVLVVGGEKGRAPVHTVDVAYRGERAELLDADYWRIPAGWYGRQTEPTAPRGWSPWLKGPRDVKVTDLRSVRVQLTRR